MLYFIVGSNSDGMEILLLRQMLPSSTHIFSFDPARTFFDPRSFLAWPNERSTVLLPGILKSGRNRSMQTNKTTLDQKMHICSK